MRWIEAHPRRSTAEIEAALAKRGEESESVAGDAGRFADWVRGAEQSGLVVELPGEGWELALRTRFRVGTVRIGSAGHGEVRVPIEPDDPVFVRDSHMGEAVHGDRALVRITRPARPGRLREGVVVAVVERTTKIFRGRYHAVKRGGVVLPTTRGAPREIWIPPGAERGATDGDLVLARIDPGSRSGSLRGSVVVELSSEGDFATDFAIIQAEFELPGEHPAAAMTQAEAAPAPVDGAPWPDREDLRGLVAFTIDPDDARDFDDAVSLETVSRGVRLGVHIADVSHYVPSGSPLDRNAAERGTSVYLPGVVIPMLPERLANDLSSLRPHTDRLTKSVFITYSPDGEALDVEISRSVIRSRRRFTYGEVQRILDDTSGSAPSGSGRGLPPDHAEYSGVLKRMDRLRQALRARRLERGMLEIDLPKLRLVTDDAGGVVGLERDERDPSHELIEEFMIAANEAVARHFVARRLPFVSRAHPPPDEGKVADLQELVEALGFEPPSPTHRDLQRLAREVAGTPLAPAIYVALLRTMGHAEYVHGAGSHFALATDRYCHFTSPIRRYPDLLIHQILEEQITGRLTSRRAGEWNARLEELAARASELERRAESAERAMTQLRLIRYLEPRIGEEMDAWITSVHPFGFFVQVESLLLEGLVHVATLGDDFYRFDKGAMALRASRGRVAYRLGDRVRVALSALDADQREVSFRLIETLRSP